MIPGTEKSIGTGRMRPDGTIEVRLKTNLGGTHGEVLVVYPPMHAEYESILAHVGGLRPEEEKPLPPWRDPCDPSRVEAAARAHAATKGWDPGSYKIVIVGRDAAGNASVTLSHLDDRRLNRPGGGKSVSLGIDPKSYVVVCELYFQ
jgi:hypothetical protein